MATHRPRKNVAALLQTAVETIRANGVVMENVQSEVRVLTEAVDANTKAVRSLEGRMGSLEGRVDRLEAKVDAGFARLDAKIDAVEARLSERIGRLEDAVRTHSVQIRDLCTEVARLRDQPVDRFDRRINARRPECDARSR